MYLFIYKYIQYFMKNKIKIKKYLKYLYKIINNHNN